MIAKVPYKSYEWLRDNRAEVSSWAVWEEPPATLDTEVGLTTKRISEADFFKVSDEAEYWDGIGQALRRDVLLVGLNPAARKDEHGAVKRDDRLFGCFHDDHPKQVKDHRLRAVSYHWGLWGAYIVDLDPITVEASSEIAMGKLLSEPGHRKECSNLLLETFEVLTPPRDSLVVLLGSAVQKVSRMPEFRKVFDHFFEEEPRTIWHYSHRGGLEKRIANAQKVLGDPQDTSNLWVPEREARA